MKKYILTIFGDFDTKEICCDIAREFQPMVDSKHLKFQHRKGVMIFHFASEMDMTDIHEFLEISSLGLYDSFILSEFTDNVSVCMDSDVIGHLFDLENTDCDHEILINTKGEEMEDFEDDDDDFVSVIMDELKGKLKQPSLDSLLDKISNNGLESLTPYEKGILDTYSK